MSLSLLFRFRTHLRAVHLQLGLAQGLGIRAVRDIGGDSSLLVALLGTALPAAITPATASAATLFVTRALRTRLSQLSLH
ncbi:MAG: hypothetical protein OEV81_17690, partial [Betaproteobacteria bacterium]|nr:hypothetical protein [Betaproteobacteria bacterium]